jgi:hypothetical protein
MPDFGLPSSPFQYAFTVIDAETLDPARAGDFDGNGRSDLVWRNAVTGVTAMWRMNGAVLVQGDHADDALALLGWKPTLTIEGIAARSPIKFSVELAVTTFEGSDEASKDDFSAATPVGEAPLVPGKGARHRVLLADFGSPLAVVGARGAVTINPGVTYTAVEGVTPHGVLGYVADVTQDTTLELMVPFSAAYPTKFRAGTYMHALIEVTEGTNAMAFYFPKLEIASDPVRNDEGSLTGHTLSFRAHENDAATVLTGTNLEKHRSRMHILLRA